MTLAAWEAPFCLTLRDCGCCGARGGLVCREPFDHAGIHFFWCKYCGRDRDCMN